jgi:hypothetical protein
LYTGISFTGVAPQEKVGLSFTGVAPLEKLLGAGLWNVPSNENDGCSIRDCLFTCVVVRIDDWVRVAGDNSIAGLLNVLARV